MFMPYSEQINLHKFNGYAKASDFISHKTQDANDTVSGK